MDRSTQVSFPTSLLEREEKRRRMRRHNTSAEINLSVRGGFGGHGGKLKRHVFGKKISFV